MSNTEIKEKKRNKSVKRTVMTVVGIVLCLIFIPIIVINFTLLVKKVVNKDEVPSVFGVFPMIVLTDSMKGTFNSGDLIICKAIDASAVKQGDVICFFDPSSNNGATVTHRVIGFSQAPDGSSAWVTKGDANNAADRVAVPFGNLVGVYRFRIAGLGHVAMFLQSTAGILICIAVPIILLLLYEFFSKKSAEKQRSVENEALRAELAELKGQQDDGNVEGNEETPPDKPE